ncbi:FAD:protein FMN transferase [bioreactor metagenome]|uniref:FAD:protein FMN transferase n=1 Tax=bioreactor metagenome TaxID=1076179 RepID=A0A645CBB2_9ZZZZ
MVEIGGELRGFGTRPDGRPWQIQLAATGTEQDAPWVVPVTNGAFATSGDCWHHFLSDGQRYSHTLDPRTGWPTRHALASVTVHHGECIHADALATVLTVMGPREGMAFAQDHGIAAVFQEHADGDGVRARRQPLVAPAWKARFER